MTYKDLGPNVSQFPQEILPGLGQYTADDHSWESVVLQQEKPITDWEMNLVQETLGRSGNMGPASKLLPSCFISNTFSDRSDILGDYVFLTPDLPATTANKFYLKSSELIVNGWRIKFDLTDLTTSGFNQIQLPAPPGGSKRTDLVILEVWRALVSPAPSMDNKSVSGQILRYGNAKSPDQFPPGNQNLADDLIDPTYLAESARRVQIQYRYRVIPGIDIATYPDGLEDPTVFGNTVPYLGISGVDGSATAYLYERASYDTGLWVAGENNATGVTNLGTVDGYMYAIPICAVARRNSAGFSKFGAGINGGISMTNPVPDRPDGLYADQIVSKDVLDLRRGVAWDFNEVLDKTFQEVLSNTLTTRMGLDTNVSGTSNFTMETISNPASGMGVPDGVRTSFSDRRVTESVVHSQAVVGPTNVILISLTAIETHWGPSFDLVLNSPFGVTISSVTKVRVYDGVAIDYDAMAGGPPTVTGITLSAVGSFVDTVTITFDANISAVTVLTELLISYPSGRGASSNVVTPHALWIPPAANIAPWLDVTASTFTATVDPNRNALYGSSTYPGPLWECDPTHRELSVRLRTTVQNWVAIADGVSDTIWLPDILDPNVAPVLSVGVVLTSTAWTTFTAIRLTAVPAAGPITITYQARRPLPPLQAFPGDSYQFFYESRAIQSDPVPAGTVTFNLAPRAIGKSLHSVLNGSASPDSGSPFISPSEQIPIGVIPAVLEHELDSPSSIGVLGLDLTSGYVSVPTVIPYSPDASRTTLFSDAPDTTVDSELRNFWPKSDNSVEAVYKPFAIGPALSTNVNHKVAVPVLMEVKQDMPSSPPFRFRKGTLVLVVFTRWVESDENSISLSGSLSSSCAAVYRVRGNLLNPRRSSGVDPGPSV